MSRYKESVELTFVYLIEGCGKTLSETNDTIPHTVVDMGHQGAECTYPQNLHEVSVVPCHPSDKKTTTFSIKDLRKTLSQYVIPDGSTDWLYKSKHFSFTDNTHWGIAT